MAVTFGIVSARLERTKDFYINVLGFDLAEEKSDGFIVVSQDRRSSVLVVSEGHNEGYPCQTGQTASAGTFFVLQVQDIEAVFDFVVAQQITPLNVIQVKPSGEQWFSVHDPNGIEIVVIQKGAIAG